MKCVNEKCNRDADTLTAVLVSADGDFACSPACKREYEKQRDHFLNVTIHDDKEFDAWMRS